MKKNAPILDACCGSRMFHFDKDNENVIFMDNRELDTILCDGRVLNIKPDILGDFRSMEFPDEHFYAVIFDPPHLNKIGAKTWMAQKYGVLTDNWKNDIRDGFRECMRVLKPYGTLIFKWNQNQIPASEVIKAIGQCPVIGNRSKTSTIWMFFMKLSKKGITEW